MTIQEFNALSHTMQEAIKAKAKEVEKDLEKYLADTDANYCIMVAERNHAILAWDNKYNYIVYGSMDEALEDAEVGDCIVTETVAISMLDYIAVLKEKIAKVVGNTIGLVQ